MININYIVPNLQEILLASSFMTPVESRNSNTINRVRCFSEDALVSSVAAEKWDLVKVICTQPYNKHVQYGLAFVKIHGIAITSPNISESSTISSSKTNDNEMKKLGHFKLREDSSDSNDADSGSLFSRWKQNRDQIKPSSSMTTATAIREASSSATSESMINIKKIAVKHSSFAIVDSDDEGKSKKKRNTDKILYDEADNDDDANRKLEKKLNLEKQKVEKLTSSQSSSSDKEKKKNMASDKPKGEKLSTSQNSSQEKKINDKLNRSSSNINNDSLHSNSKQNEIKNTPTSSKFKDFLDSKLSPSSSTFFFTCNGAKPKKRPSSPLENQVSKKKMLSYDTDVKMIYKPFKTLFNGVTFVISGIQNPDRGEIRRKALEMGAKYKPDWDSQCTHLICAFKNTPKYNQVKGHGKIINQAWIHDSYAKKMRLPWRRYALQSKESKQPESEEEIFDESLKPKPEPSYKERDSVSPDLIEIKEKIVTIDVDDDNFEYDSGEDTEEEIERIQKEQENKRKNGNSDSVDKDNFDESTDAEEQNSNTESPDDFFKTKKFFLDSKNISSIEIIKLKNFIRMHKGELVKEITSANCLISNKNISIDSNSNGCQTIKPIWVFECHDMDCLLPVKRYVID